MSSKEVLLTKEGYKELEERLDYLKTKARHDIADKISLARSYGDLSENAEYDEAKQEQGFIEGEILELEYKLKNAVIIDDQKGPKGIVKVGSTVKLIDMETEEEMQYTIVGSDEADLDVGRISNESAVGKAILGQKVGTTVTIHAPMCDYDMKIIQVK